MLVELPLREAERLEEELWTSYRLKPSARIQRIQRGQSNSNFLIRVDGSRLVLRVTTGESERIAREIKVLRSLRACNWRLQTPEPVKGVNGSFLQILTNSSCCALFRFIDGWDATPCAGLYPDRHLLQSIAHVIVELHTLLQHAIRDTALPHNSFNVFSRVVQELDQAVFFKQLPSRLSEPVRLALQRCETLKQLGLWSVPIHGDIRFANLLFDRDANVLGVLDFETVGFAGLSLEVAFAVRNLIFSRAHTVGCEALDLTRAFVSYISSALTASGDRTNDIRLGGWLEYSALEELHALFFGNCRGIPIHLHKKKLESAEAFLNWLTHPELAGDILGEI